MTEIQRNVHSLFILRADANRWDDSDYRDEINSWIDKGIGGIGVFIGDLEPTISMIQDMKSRGGSRLIFAADYEYGLPMRLSGGIAYPRAMALGKNNVETTYEVAQHIAREMLAIGVQWNWAPVADINSNPQNPIINTRSFGSEPDTVSRHVSAFVKGLQAEGVAACLKHAPGHGDTVVDSHIDLPTMHSDPDLADDREFVPFKDGIKAGVKSIMMAHLCVPFLDTVYPASLSSAIVGGLVKGAWGFAGLVVTDALDMGAITKSYTSGIAAQLAFKAGADALILPENVSEAVAGVLDLAETDAGYEERMVDALKRWSDFRSFLKSSQKRTSEKMIIDQPQHAQLALKAANKAISIVGDEKLLPLTQHEHVAVFGIVSENDTENATTFFHYLAQGTENNVDFGYIDGTIEEADLEELKKGTTDANVFVFVLFGKAVAFKGNIHGTENLPRIINAIKGNRPCIVVACGSPYGVEELPSHCTLYTFSDTMPSVAAVVLRLIGRTAD